MTHDYAMRAYQAVGLLRSLEEGQDGDTRSALEILEFWLQKLGEDLEREGTKSGKGAK